MRAETAREMERTNTAEDVLQMVRDKIEEGKYRTIDLFRKIDDSGDGQISATELRGGLLKMGVRMTAKEFRLLLQIVDRDGSGEVSLKELDRGLKAVERRAQTAPAMMGPTRSNRGPFNREHEHFQSAFSWASRSIRMADRQAAERSPRSWVPHSQGPAAAAKAIPVGRGNVVDASVLRERLHDRAGAPGAVPPSEALVYHTLPTYRTVYKSPIFSGRFGKVANSDLADNILSSRATCKYAQRTLGESLPHGGVRTFECSSMKSSVDKVLRNEEINVKDLESGMDRLFHGCYGQQTRKARIDTLFMDDIL